MKEEIKKIVFEHSEWNETSGTIIPLKNFDKLITKLQEEEKNHDK